MVESGCLVQQFLLSQRRLLHKVLSANPFLALLLAIIESKMIIGTIAQQYRLETVSDQPLNFSPSLTLHPKNPIKMKVQPR